MQLQLIIAQVDNINFNNNTNTNTNANTNTCAKVIEDIITKDTYKFNESNPKPVGAQLVGDHWSGAISWSARDIVRYHYYYYHYQVIIINIFIIITAVNIIIFIISKKKRNAHKFFLQEIFLKLFGEFKGIIIIIIVLIILL